MTGKKTPLYEVHEKLGANIIDFNGWLMPIKYSSVIDEHNTIRKKAGLFDVSHMGEFLIFGKKASEFIDNLITNDIKNIDEEQCIYSPMCNENGTIIDDLLVYKHTNEHYMLVVNASNIDKDFQWIEKIKKELYGSIEEDELHIRDVSESTAMMALQGPESVKILSKVTDVDVKKIKRFRFKDNVLITDVKTLISRTGYTGEDGFEIYVNADDAIDVWNSIMDAGGKNIKPIGLAARDTLRLEAGLMLYGNDIDDTTTPLEAAIEWTVKLNKDVFIGKDELLRQKAEGPEKKMVGLEMIEKGIPRTGYTIRLDLEDIGVVTSGTFSPTYKKSIGIGYVKTEYSEIGIIFDVMIREKPCKAKVVELPFYSKR